MRFYYIFFILLFIGCEKKKLTYKTIETKNYFLTGYSYTNGTDKIFPNELVLIDKNTKDTIYKCENCYRDFHIILEDTILIYGGKKLDSMITNKLIIKRIPVPANYKYNSYW
jgi:lipoprotein